MDIVNGVTFKAIALKLDLDIATVKTIRNRPHVRKFISSYLNEASVREKAYREELLAQIVEARLNNLSEDDDLSSLSNKDTLDIIMALDNIQKEKEKAELGTKDNPVVNILNLIKKD
jgi:rRNA maturation endonuclease Nob1